jgi:hypothetical protein
MEAGTVFKWNNFKDRKYGGELKPRWFIYLGDTGILTNPIIAHISTTTTNKAAFEPGGSRYNHSICNFYARETPFEDDSILDINEAYYPIERDRLENNPDIEIKGRLTDDQMRMIYNRFRSSDQFSKKVLLDMHESFNKAGIIGLKKPKQ